jgi:hypothetical protein
MRGSRIDLGGKYTTKPGAGGANYWFEVNIHPSTGRDLKDLDSQEGKGGGRKKQDPLAAV